MDDKKKTVPEETKDTMTGRNDVVEFDDIRDALGKLDAKMAAIEQEKKDASKADASKAEDTKAEEEAVAITQISGIVEEKAEEKTEEQDAKTEKGTESKSEKQEKEETANQTTEDKKEAEDTKVEEPKEGTASTSSSKALTQSKRLEDAKAAQNSLKDAKADKVSKENVTETKPVKEKKGKKGVAIFFGVVAAMLILVYGAGFVYFSNYFYPDVTINGTNVSNMNQETAKTTLDDFYKNYILTMETIDGKQVTIAGTDIMMNIKLHDEFDKCLKEQRAYLWFLNMMEHHDYTIGADVTWDAESLEKIFDGMKMLDKKLMTAPKDAYIGMEGGKLAIIKEELGTTMLVDKFCSVVEENLSKVIAGVNLKEAGCYELPQIYSSDEALKKEFDAKSAYIGGAITLQLDDLTLEPEMELYDAVLEKKGDSYSISKTKVQAYVKDLAARYDTLGKDRNFTSSFENKRQVKVSGTAFGYEMDQEATANALYAALEKKEAATVEAVFKNKGYTLQGENDIGDTYIEVNLSLQKVVAYKDGKKIVEGDCVSGCEVNGNGTCLGLYKIQDKLSPTVLRGEKEEVTKTVVKKNKKGKKVKVKETTMEYSYESPVTFWLQFNGGFGLHDAAGWRSVYGGSIYYYSGSHGCVNLPYDVAQKLYETFQLGDPVVVYFWDNENRK